jgi:hypothetical protein
VEKTVSQFAQFKAIELRTHTFSKMGQVFAESKLVCAILDSSLLKNADVSPGKQFRK